MTSTSSSSEYTEECKQIEYALTRDLKKNLRDGESVEDFKPLKECTVGSDGRVTEVYLVSERNNQSTIESVFGSQSLTKVTYLINNDFYQRDPAVFNDYPRNIKKLENLEELNLKYYLVSFEHGEYPLVSGDIKKGALALTSKKIKTLTFDHINLSKDNIKEIKKLTSLETLEIDGGEIADVEALKKLNLKSLVINGEEYITSPSEYTGECKQMEEALINNLKKNLRDGELAQDFKPLRECVVDSDGFTTEVYIVSERNNQNTIEDALATKRLTKVTYLINNDFYQRDPAVFNDYPENIKNLPNLEELNLKYYLESFDHGEYPILSGDIKKGALALTSKKIKTLTFDHINLSKDNIKEIKKLTSLETLIIEGGEIADVKSLKKLKNLKTLIINGKNLKKVNAKEY